ncbi:Sec-independent protein translocase protein TatB [Derxia gummosa]|uniref:Sec-independent protein translocase protein TatB n=1 Tax=Derxia gummosa DSM 723 TaxID=1121388 RepID=A0A8B6XAA0_9BURK|nr:Sec-independent protein translocase protein TatB [Derxia gummosa]
MLDFSFGELTIIGAVALVVLGPEKLPKVARTMGQWVAKAQRYVNDVKADINREVELAELRKMQQQIEESARELKKTVDENVQTVHQEIDAARREVQQLNAETESAVAAASTPHSGDHAGMHADAGTQDSTWPATRDWQNDPHNAFAQGEFIKPAPTVEQLADELAALRRLLAEGDAPAGFKYAPRARAARPRRALRRTATS